MLVVWVQTFRDPDREPLIYAGVEVYRAGTSVAARVFDENKVLSTDSPPVYTNGAGRVCFYLDTDDYSSGQLFDIICTPNSACSNQDIVSLTSMQLFDDTEGYRFFKNITAQATAPTEGMRDGDLWIDTDANNEIYVYDVTDGWVSRRDGTIVEGAITTYFQTTAPSGSSHNDGDLWFDTNDENKCYRWNGSSWVANNYDVADWDKIYGNSKPDDDADVTGDHTALNVVHINDSSNESGYSVEIYGDLHMRNGTDIGFYDSGNAWVGGIYSGTAGSTAIKISASFVPYSSNSIECGSNSFKWLRMNVGDNGIYIGNSTDVHIHNSGSHNRYDVKYNDFSLYDVNNSKSMIYAAIGGGVKSYYNGVKKLEVTVNGITVTGSCTGCDYVFEQNYDLMSFDKLQTYIAKHERLPNMTVNRGLEIDFDAFRKELVEKVEENVLYILQLHKRLKVLEI